MKSLLRSLFSLFKNLKLYNFEKHLKERLRFFFFLEKLYRGSTVFEFLSFYNFIHIILSILQKYVLPLIKPKKKRTTLTTQYYKTKIKCKNNNSTNNSASILSVQHKITWIYAVAVDDDDEYVSALL